MIDYIFDSSIIANRLKTLREEWQKKPKEYPGDTRKKEDFAAKVGIKRQTLYKYEDGIVTPPIEKLLNYCNVCNCDLDYIIGRIDKKTKEEQTICEVLNISEVSAENLTKLSTPGLDLLDSFLSQTSLLFLLSKEYFDSTHSHFTQVSFTDSVTGRKEELSPERSHNYIKQRALDIFSKMMDQVYEKNSKQAIAEMVQTIFIMVLTTIVKMKANTTPKIEVLDFITEYFKKIKNEFPEYLEESEITDEYANNIYDHAEGMLFAMTKGNIEDDTIKEYIGELLITKGLRF